MTGYTPFLIAPFATGLDTDLASWLLPQDAFKKIENAHVHHGVVEKRDGYFKLNDLVHYDTTNWDISGITQADPGVVTVADTTGLLDGDEIEMRNVGGMIEVNGNRYYVANVAPTTFELNDADGANIDTTTGFTAYTLGGTVNLVAKKRVMGLERYIDSSNVKQLLAFDTERACLFDSTNQRFNPLDGADIFTSSDTDYIWSDNWASTADSSSPVLYRLYFTNGKSNAGGTTDGIRYYDGSATVTNQYNPDINASTSPIEIRGCKLIFAFRQRLVLLHTFEGANTYPQRARWCQVQNPNDANAWDDSVAGKGGFVDAPTGDHIISARFVQDMLIVLFTDSVWTLRPVSDPALPFRWDKINDFRACDAKMGSIGFDRSVIAAGIRGLTATDGVETARIDQRIEDFVKDEINNSEFDKTFFLRSYGDKRLWMLYSGLENADANKALIYDEESKAFSTYLIGMNVLGYGGVAKDNSLNDFTDEAAAANKLPLTLNDSDDLQINSFVFDANDEIFLGGDRSGTVFTLESGGSDEGASIELNLESAAWNPFREEGKECQLGYLDLYLDTNENTLLNVDFFKNNDPYAYAKKTINCLPDLKEIALISNISKKSPTTDGVTVTATNHGLTTGDIVYIYLVEGMEEINGGPFTVTVVNVNLLDIAIDSTSFTAYTRGGVLTENRFIKSKIWKRVYAGGIGYQNKVKINSIGINRSLSIRAFIPWFRPRGKRLI